jgi:hypothetical protein
MSALAVAWLALLLVLGSGALWFRRMARVEIPRNRAGFVLASLVGAGLGVVALVQGAGWLGGVPAALAILGGAFFSFTVSISRQKLGDEAIQVGARLPEVSAPDEHGASFALSSLAGRPLLLKFFRGHW